MILGNTVANRALGIGGDSFWQKVTDQLLAGKTLLPIQQKAIQADLLSGRKNFIISAPTNSGKSLVGTLALLQALRRNQRAVLLEPLRALANEQAETLKKITASIETILGVAVKVRVSTGDYRLDDEQFSDPAPVGELIVATPERFEAILRNPENEDWVSSIGAVCVDEAHMIGDPHRGVNLEFLITTLLCLPTPPRLVLLSATLGNLDSAREWLMPCEVVKVTERVLPLKKEVIELSTEQKANEAVCEWLTKQLSGPDAQALVFVYKPSWAEALAKELTNSLGQLAGETGAFAYHAKMSSATREKIRHAFLEGRSKIVVTTSALALGVNLPATHVVVRDLTYPGASSPNISDILQMMGRAGRGDKKGHAVVIQRPTDQWGTSELSRALDEHKLPDFCSALEKLGDVKNNNNSRIAPLIASLLSRSAGRGLTRQQIEKFLYRSFGAKRMVNEIDAGLHWLEWQALSFQEENHYRLTVLGQKATLAVLPLPLAAGFAQLIRDLLTIDPNDKILGQWKPLDHLVTLSLLFERAPNLRLFSKALADQVDSWCEASPENTPILYRKWIIGLADHSKASELIGSLGIPIDSNKNPDEWARRQGYLATFKSIVIYERGLGRTAEYLSRRYDVKKLDGIEERWRDEMLWLLTGLSKIFDIRTFYFHLHEECEADYERIKRVKRLLGNLRHQVFDLQYQIKYCSALGPVLRDMKRIGDSGVGIQTIRKLEQSGVTNLKDLYNLGLDGMIERGVRRDIAKKISSYLRRRAA